MCLVSFLLSLLAVYRAEFDLVTLRGNTHSLHTENRVPFHSTRCLLVVDGVYLLLKVFACCRRCVFVVLDTHTHAARWWVARVAKERRVRRGHHSGQGSARARFSSISAQPSALMPSFLITKLLVVCLHLPPNLLYNHDYINTI